MCGIVGYVGEKPVVPILLDGLKHLEYRGYDSAGLAVLTSEGRIVVHKAAGKLARLERMLEGRAPAGTIGVGHTRWATHGAPTTPNAHPHFDCQGKLAVVHNGIIENYSSLREELISQGHLFRSQTDTEVLAHLVEAELGKLSGEGEGRLLEAVQRALSRVRGSYAIAVLSQDYPGILVGARMHAPLIVGLGEGENFLASDIPAILHRTRRAIPMEEGELVAISRSSIQLYSRQGLPIQREPIRITWDTQGAEKGGYPHFVLKEIYEQPVGLSNTLSGRVEGDLPILEELAHLDLTRVGRAYIVACGSSFYAGLYGKLAIEHWARLPVEVAPASEFRYGDPLLDERTLCILISQSGETADTLAALRLAREAGALTLAITNVMASSIARDVDGVLYLQTGPEIGVVATKTFTAELALLCLLALKLARTRGTMGDGPLREVVRALRAVPRQVEEVLAKDAEIERLAGAYSDRRSFFFFGRGWGYPVALEGALKLKEISYIHAEGYPAGELKHGPIAMLDPTIPVVAIATASSTYEKIISSIEEVRARQAEVVAIASDGDDQILQHADHAIFIPRTPPPLSTILATVPLQLLAYHVAVALGRDVDQPRNLAKSVTVE